MLPGRPGTLLLPIIPPGPILGPPAEPWPGPGPGPRRGTPLPIGTEGKKPGLTS